MRIILLLLVALLASCGSKKKTTQKSKTSTEINEALKVNELTEKGVVKESLTTQNSELHQLTFNSDVRLTQADPDKEITLTDPDGRVTIIKGANALISHRREETHSKDSIVQKTMNKSIEVSTKAIESNTTTKAESKERNTDVVIERGFPWWLLILVIVIYSAISIWRKTLNPVKWV